MDSKAPTQAILDALAARLAELEAAHAQQRERTASLERDNARLREEMVTLRAGGGSAPRPAGSGRGAPRLGWKRPATGNATTPAGRTSRRGMLGTAAKVAVATAAAGVLVERVGTRTAFASGPGSFDSSTAGVPAVLAQGANGADGVDAFTDSGYGINAQSTSGAGVSAFGGSYGVYATTTNGTGIRGISDAGVGVYATSTSNHALQASTNGAAVNGIFASNTSNTSSGIAALGHSDDGFGGLGPGIGVKGETAGGMGVTGTATTGTGVNGTTAGGASTQAMYAVGTSGSTGLRATSDTGDGIVAASTNGTGINVQSATGSAVVATSGGVGYGLYLTATSGWAIGCVGRIRVLGNAVGTVTLASGTTSKTVSSSACSGSSQVILTPTINPQVSIWATVAPGGFTVHASGAPSSDVTFSYFLIN